MGVKWFALVLLALLAGFGGGFVFNYLVFQQQIDNFRVEISKLKEQVADLSSQVSTLKSIYSSINTLLGMQNELNELKSTLLAITLLLQQLLSGEGYARFERLEITSAYAEYNDEKYDITLNIKNSGSADAIIDNILLNGKPPSEYLGKIINISPSLPLLVRVGNSTSITIEVEANAPFTAGTSIEVRIHTAAGQEYPKTITLP